MSERPPISPRSPRAALEPEQVPPPPKRSERARNPFVIVGNAIITIILVLMLGAGGVYVYGKKMLESAGPLAEDKTVNIPPRSKTREIAETLDLHESTISRVTTQKFMRTPRGIFELKYFFGSHVATDTGGACSATAIRALIKQMVNAENAKKPLSDSQISEILGQQGIVVARRTVAKYRESIQIPPVNLRKSF